MSSDVAAAGVLAGPPRSASSSPPPLPSPVSTGAAAIQAARAAVSSVFLCWPPVLVPLACLQQISRDTISADRNRQPGPVPPRGMCLECCQKFHTELQLRPTSHLVMRERTVDCWTPSSCWCGRHMIWCTTTCHAYECMLGPLSWVPGKGGHQEVVAVVVAGDGGA